MNEPKIYAPISAKAIQTPKGYRILKLSANVDRLIAFLTEHKNDRGWVNMNCTARKETGKHGETHTVCLDTWKPEPKQPAFKTAEPTGENSDDDVPF
jgi:hypothetical protein